MANKKPRQLMAEDHGLQTTEQGSAPIHVAVPNIATILDTLAMILWMYHAVVGLVHFFFSIPIATESQD